ncbi:pilus assembly protein [Gilvimarinus sp. SDUM040013]|uniref:Pilus assembly protein n=1 Tax=Gilvimarinus gilvus TaxID=3058038 RepID=A0ABU4RWQ1_9GAMM|nr:pilus assembly protein [Gilvimarinus sp. SDUM040013]MDO3385687.1 pilus assembly protein [Gilvimarinus sp. SDUM040013]MDX6849325.1 pilus assembly protein [Gilvimarinus sp. SDUM040013]
MTTETAERFNPSSLKLVHDELVATIESAAGRLEQFAADLNNGELLQHCIDDIKQIRGTLSLLQLRGVDLLADELVEHITDIPLGEASTCIPKLEKITSVFFILPRYLEYCTQTGRSMAVLLIPHINDLRIARRAKPITLGHYYPLDANQHQRPEIEEVEIPEDLRQVIKRLRHMYQVAMLNVLQGKQVKPSLGMMERSMQRLDKLSANRPLGVLWWVAAEFMSSLQSEQLLLTKERKLMFSVLDRELKRLMFEGEEALNRAPAPEVLKELVFQVVLARTQSARSQAIIEAFSAPVLPYNEMELVREQEYLKGPSANTVSSMTAVLQDELRSTKNILERAAQGGIELLRDSPELVETLKKVSDILAVVGLAAPSKSLKEEIDRIVSWQKGEVEANTDDLLGVADTMLYIESTVSGLSKMSLSEEKLAALNALSREEALSSSQIMEAEALVIEEAEAGLALIKRGLSSYAESNYDIGHIKNVASTLTSVRGGMLVLNLPRAAAVVAASERFVNEALLGSEPLAAVQHLLETFADAIISLEYYLDALKSDKNADTNVLLVAEESLQALGFPAAS